MNFKIFIINFENNFFEMFFDMNLITCKRSDLIVIYIMVNLIEI